MTDTVNITRTLVSKYGINLRCNEGRDAHGKFVDFQPSDLAATEGFTIRVRIGWRSIESEFIPGNFSAELIRSMGKASREKKDLFCNFLQATKEPADQIEMSINDLPADPGNHSSWPEDWSSLNLVIRKSPVAIDNADTAAIAKSILTYGGRLLAVVLSLLPVEEIELREIPVGLPEGARIRVEVNRYERNHLNRAACIEAHGSKCSVCDFDFGVQYGEIGYGYIHVHHLTPVSQIDENYIINPTKDLVPVCPNCHAMLHRKDSPFTIEELKDKINRS